MYVNHFGKGKKKGNKRTFELLQQPADECLALFRPEENRTVGVGLRSRPAQAAGGYRQGSDRLVWAPGDGPPPRGPPSGRLGPGSGRPAGSASFVEKPGGVHSGRGREGAGQPREGRPAGRRRRQVRGGFSRRARSRPPPSVPAAPRPPPRPPLPLKMEVTKRPPATWPRRPHSAGRAASRDPARPRRRGRGKEGGRPRSRHSPTDR